MAREVLAGWGGTAPSVADVAYPADVGALGAVVAGVARAGAGRSRGVIARGLGRSYGDAAQNAGGTVIATSALALATADPPYVWVDEAGGLVRVAGGVSLDALMRDLVPAGWFVPVTPGTRQVTVGGAIAADIHGKNHHRDGSFVRHVTEITLAQADGSVARVTEAADPALFWATAGGLGLTGVILDATIRLLPVRTSWVRVVTERAGELDDVMARMAGRDERHRYSVAWVDGLAGGRRLGRGVITWGDHAERDELRGGARRGGAASEPLAFDPGSRIGVPGAVPGGLLTPTTVAAFNRWWFHRAPARGRTTVEPLGRFFHPLDAVSGWNRLYGRRGFVQYQFVVPFGGEHVVRVALERLRAPRCPSFLAVLKRMGDGTPGPLSFPLAGWTLALDIPAGVDGVSQVLDDLDDLVATSGGRVYLAKDARLRPEVVGVMYPELEAWRAVKERVDPTGVFTSDLARRLGLATRRRAAGHEVGR